MKLVLAIETSGRIGSVALGCGSTVLGESFFSGFMKQSAELLPQIQTLLKNAHKQPCDIENVIITAGPGSFTGLRIAVTAAKMLHFAHGCNIIAVDSTNVIAENATDYADSNNQEPIGRICTILDAKRNMFYVSVFDRGPEGWRKIFGTQAATAEMILDWLEKQDQKKVYFLGEGLVYYANKFEKPFTAILDEQYWMPRAANLLKVGTTLAATGQFANPSTLTPLYIRKPDAVEMRERRLRR